MTLRYPGSVWTRTRGPWRLGASNVTVRRFGVTLLSVAGRDRSSGTDPDNWFDEPDLSEIWEARTGRLARSRRPPLEGERANSIIDSTQRRPWSGLAGPPVALVAAAALGVTVLLGLLAAAGVFSTTHATGFPTLQTTAPPPPLRSTQTQPSGAQPSMTIPSAPLAPGAQGTAVQQLQRVLAYLGYSPGAIDGRYGPSTEAAVRRFQQAHRLVLDGVAGSATLTALKSALP